MFDPEMKMGRCRKLRRSGPQGEHQGVEVDGCSTQESNQPAPPQSASNTLQDLSGQACSLHDLRCHAQTASCLSDVRKLSWHAGDRERRRTRVIQGRRNGRSSRLAQCR